MTWTVSNILVSRLSKLQGLNTSLSHRDLSISVCIDTWSSDFLSGNGSTINNIFASSILEYLQDKLQGTVYTKNLLTQSVVIVCSIDRRFCTFFSCTFEIYLSQTFKHLLRETKFLEQQLTESCSIILPSIILISSTNLHHKFLEPVVLCLVISKMKIVEELGWQLNRLELARLGWQQFQYLFPEMSYS